MAWLKVETVTPDKPEISYVAVTCKCSLGDAFLAWFRFQAWADAVTDDGWIGLATPEMADAHARLAGFGHAMQDAGWLTFMKNGVQIQRYDRHNGKSAKRRAVESERQRRLREKYEYAKRHASTVTNVTHAA